jgi:hypothetical protein
VKLNVPTVALPNVTVNAAPSAVGVNVAGAMVHVAGASAVHVSATLPLYPLIEVSIPFQVMFWFTTVVFGVAVTAIEKSPAEPTVSFSKRVAWVRVPSVPWMAKLNAPADSLLNVTVN